jgi:hypothetical protein
VALKKSIPSQPAQRPIMKNKGVTNNAGAGQVFDAARRVMLSNFLDMAVDPNIPVSDLKHEFLATIQSMSQILDLTVGDR